MLVREIGLSLPIFIKWDDAEFGLRANEAGYPTVSLPGAAVWHVPWTDKDDTIDWQAYYHARNRMLAALLHSPYPRGGRLIPESLATRSSTPCRCSTALPSCASGRWRTCSPARITCTAICRPSSAEIRAFRSERGRRRDRNGPAGLSPSPSAQATQARQGPD